MKSALFGSPRKVYLIGIGGIALSYLARWFKAQKWSVEGSDIISSSTTDELKKAGIKVNLGQKGASIPSGTALVVYSKAIKSDNAALEAARAENILIMSHAEVVGGLTAEYKTVAIAGAHGKSTTTSLIGLGAMRAKLDPTIFVGTKLKELGNLNFRNGKSDLLILEADEYGKTFLNYTPQISVVTNIDKEHIDIYKNLAGIKKAFLDFLLRVNLGGTIIVNADNEHLFSLKEKIVGIAKKNKAKVIWYSRHSPHAKKIARIMKIPGVHNVSNATAAYHALRILGVSEKKILESLGGYKGSWRRFEYKGFFRPQGAPSPIPVYDDYAHHPTEIQATLAAFKEKFPKENIICVFQPHQAKRLQSLFSDFEKSFDNADTLVLLPLYKVPGRDELVNPRYTSEELVKRMQKKNPGKSIFYLREPKKLKEVLTILTTVPASCGFERPQPLRPSVIVMMGAGDIVDHTRAILGK